MSLIACLRSRHLRPRGRDKESGGTELLRLMGQNLSSVSMSTFTDLIHTSPQDIINQINFLWVLRSFPLRLVIDLSLRRQNTTHHLSFVNIDFLAASLCNDVERVKIQPAFILAALALAQLFRSSNADQGTLGMTEAVKLRIQAQGAFDEARQTGVLNADLAKAQFVGPPSLWLHPLSKLTCLATRGLRILSLYRI